MAVTIVARLALKAGKKYRGIPLRKGVVPAGSSIAVVYPCGSSLVPNYQIHVRGGWLDGSFSQATIWTDFPVDTEVDLITVPAPAASAPLVPPASQMGDFKVWVDGVSYSWILQASDFVNPMFSGTLTTRYRVLRVITPEVTVAHYIDVHPTGVAYSTFASLANRAEQGNSTGYDIRIQCLSTGQDTGTGHLDALAETPPLRSCLGVCYGLQKYETTLDYDLCSGVYPPIKSVPVAQVIKDDLVVEGAATSSFWGAGMQPGWMATSGERPAIGVLPNSTTLAAIIRDPALADGVYEQAGKARLWSGQQLRNNDFSMAPITEINNVWPGITAYYAYNQVAPGALAAPVPVDTAVTGLYSDNAHLPHDTFIPAVYSGDEYHIESTLFKAFSATLNNPYGTAIRIDDIYFVGQVRGAAWSLVAFVQAWALADTGSIQKSTLESWITRVIAKTQNNLTSRGPNPLGLFVDPSYSPSQRIAAWQTTHVIKALLTAHSFGFANAKATADALLVYYADSANPSFHGVQQTWNLQVLDSAGNTITTRAATAPQDENYAAIPLNLTPTQANPWDGRSLVKDALAWGGAFGNASAAAAWSYYETFSSSSFSCFYNRTGYCSQFGNKYDSRPDAFAVVSCALVPGSAATVPTFTCPSNGVIPRVITGVKSAGSSVSLFHNGAPLATIPADSLTTWTYNDVGIGARVINAFSSNQCGSSANTPICNYTSTAGTAPTYSGPSTLNIPGTVTVSGTPTPTYAFSGSAPAGMLINSSTGNITGGAPGTYSVTVVATNAAGSINIPLTVTVPAVAIPPTYTGPTSGSSVSGTGASFPLSATGTVPISFSLTGAVPAQSSIVGGNLVISTASMPAGTYTFNIVSSNGTLPNDVDVFTLTVGAALVAPTYTGPTSMAIVSGVPSSVTLSATGTAPITFTFLSALPAGVTVSGATVSYNGTPLAAGNVVNSVVSSNSASPPTDTDNFTFQISIASVAPTYTGPGSINAPGTVTANGTAPVTYAFSGVAPSGLVIDSATGNVTGTVPGTYSVVVVATNSAGSLNIPLSITVPVAPVLTAKFVKIGGKLVTYGGKIVKILV